MISVIVPFYNEEENIEPLYEQLSSTLNGLDRRYEILFVDDGSTDSTFRNMQKVCAQNGNLKILKFRKNFGQSAALKAGFDHIVISFWQKYSVRPIHVFGGLGLVYGSAKIE